MKMFKNKLLVLSICVVPLLLVFLFLSIQLNVLASETTQEVIIAFGQDIITFDPHFYVTTQDINAIQNVYETLVSYDREGNIVPKLATSWKPISPLIWEFELRKDVLFHNGTHFNADAVKFSLERCSKAGTGSGFAGFIDKVEVIDDSTVRLYLKYEYGPILNNLTNQVVGMMDPKWTEEKGDNLSQYANGTGPFKLLEFIPGSRAVFIKNENYWGKLTKLDRVEFRPIPEASTRLMALKSGEVDIIENPLPHEVPSLIKDNNFYVYTSPKNRTLFVSFNFEDDNVGGEKNKQLREAIAYAINRQEIVDYVLEGLATPADKGFMPSVVSMGLQDDSLIREYDLEKAKNILGEAGIKPGYTIEFWCTRARYLQDTETAEVIQAQLSKIGLDVKIIVMEYGPLFAGLMERKQQMYQLAWGWMTGDPSQVFHHLLDSKSKINLSAFYNDEFDRLLEMADKTVDREERMKLYNKAYKIAFNEVALIPILHYKNVYAANKKVKDLFANNYEMLDLTSVYIEN